MKVLSLRITPHEPKQALQHPGRPREVIGQLKTVQSGGCGMFSTHQHGACACWERPPLSWRSAKHRRSDPGLQDFPDSNAIAPEQNLRRKLYPRCLVLLQTVDRLEPVDGLRIDELPSLVRIHHQLLRRCCWRTSNLLHPLRCRIPTKSFPLPPWPLALSLRCPTPL